MEETNDEDVYGRRKIMKKVKAMAAAAMTVFLCGCYDPGQDITLICPVTDYMAEDGSRTLRLYLYLSEEDYAQYTKDRFNLD